MRLLVLTQVVVYPADAGPKVKTLQVLRHLAAHHEVHYCTFVRNDQEIAHAGKLRELCRSVTTVSMHRSRMSDVRFLLESLATGDSFLLRRDDRADMRSTVRKLLLEQRIDVLHVDQLNMMRFVPPDWKGTVILDEHNAVWQVVERLQRGAGNPWTHWLLEREVRLIRKLEGMACRQAQFVLAVSEHDQRALREVAGDDVPIEIVPITIDAGHFECFWQLYDPQPNKLFTIGTMFWPPNSEGVIWWLREGYEYLRSICPNVVYDIVGARPPKFLQALAQSYDGVRMHGYVADVEPFWNHASVMAVPILSGGGVRVKILEAMARGVPVVTTTIGCEGLVVRDQKHLLIADTPKAFALACLRIFQDKGLAQELALNAHQLLLEQYDAKIALNALDKAYRLACK